MFNLLVSSLSSSSCNSSIESVDEIFNATDVDSDEDSILSLELFLSLGVDKVQIFGNIGQNSNRTYSLEFFKKQPQITHIKQTHTAA